MSKIAKKLKSLEGREKMEFMWKCGKEQDKKAVIPLIDILMNDRDTKYRSTAAQALGDLRDQRAIKPLIEVLKEGVSHSQAQDNLMTKLGALEGLRKGEWVLGTLFQSGNFTDLVEVRQAAAWALGNIGDKRAVDPLINSLNDWSWMVQCEAAAALGKIGDNRAEKYLKKLLAENSDESVREAALEALEYLSD